MKRENIMRFYVVLIFILSIGISALSGCKEKQPQQPSKAEKSQEQASPQPVEKQAEAPAQEQAQEEGYVYQPRDRVDPFAPLIVPTKKAAKKGAGKLGTLESYDLSEFALLAVAKKGDRYYALLVTPDNRSFTVSEGTIIGYNKGRVEEIAKNKVILIEYIKDYRGDTRPKQIALELKER